MIKRKIAALGLVLVLTIIAVHSAFGYGYSTNPYSTSNFLRDNLRMMESDFKRMRERDEEISRSSRRFTEDQKEYLSKKVKVFCAVKGRDEAKCKKYCKRLKEYGGSNKLCKNM